MARRVFFSFHYDRDILRVNQVRNSWVTKTDRQKGFFWDNSLWEETKKKGDAALKRMIDDGIAGTSVTAVLAGRLTSERRWVRYEILRSFYDSNGILCLRIHDLRPPRGVPDSAGRNPLDYFYIRANAAQKRVYCWEWQNGQWAAPQDIKHYQDFKDFSYNVRPDIDCQMSKLFSIYDWSNGGYQRFDDWIEAAAKAVAR